MFHHELSHKSEVKKNESNHKLKLRIMEKETGKFVSFVGPSGCGKTTLLRIIEGFENPTNGTVKDDGEIVTEPSNERGFIFQNYSLYPWLNVIDNVIFGLGINGKPEKERLIFPQKAGDGLYLSGGIP